MTYAQIKTALVAAGLPAYAIEDTSANGTGHVAFVNFRDLPNEGENKALDKAIAKLSFDVADKGLCFK